VNINNLVGNNVMLFVTGAGKLSAANNKRLTLTASTSGTYSGIAIFQDAGNSSNFATGNNFTLNVSGAIYMPGANLSFPNSLSLTSSTCMLFVARSLSISNGNGQFSNSGCAGLYGGAAYLNISIAQ
jgi:hypothetical protein